MKKILNELDKIKQFAPHLLSTAHLINPLTKKQRELYDLLKILAPGSIE